MSTDKEKTRQQILRAADERIQQYGFCKTTMNEIAKDCKMSAANIYRFFDSKNDIAAELATQCFSDAEQIFKTVARDTKTGPPEKLKGLCIEKLRVNYSMFHQNPNYFEIVNFIIEERDDLIETHKNKVRAYIAEVLAEGNRIGLFDIDDVVATADTFHKAVILFHCPVFINMYTLQEMEESVENVVNLLIQGLKKE